MKKFLFMAAFGLTASATFTSCEDILGHWEKPTPVTPTPSEPEEESVPGLLTGKFTINAGGDKVQFSQGNLQAKIASYAPYVATASEWKFAANQYDCIGNAAGNNSFAVDSWVDLFSWVGTSATNNTYGLITFTSASPANHGDQDDDVLKTDWGEAAASSIGTGWRTLSSAEWTYLFNTRSASSIGTTVNARYAKAKVNNVQGMILFPDTYTHPDDVTAPTGINATDNTGWNGNDYSADDWTKMETAGAVFLPAAGGRNGTSVSSVGSCGFYWSSTANGAGNAYRVYFDSGNMSPADGGSRVYGVSVRLVRPAE